MAVTGPWVGSSAKAETGEPWMAQAGAKLRLGTPFWMSNMIGRSVFNFSLTVQYRNWNNIYYRGSWQVGGWNWSPKPTTQNTVQGNFEGKEVTLFVSVSGQGGVNYWNGDPQGTTLGIRNGDAINLRVMMSDGTTFDFTPGKMDGDVRNYQIASNDEANKLKNWFSDRTDQYWQGLITRR